MCGGRLLPLAPGTGRHCHLGAHVTLLLPPCTFPAQQRPGSDALSQLPKAVVELSVATFVQQVDVLWPHRAGLAPQADSWLVCRGRSKTVGCRACSPVLCTGLMPLRRPRSASGLRAQTGTGPGASAWTTQGTCSSKFDPMSEIHALLQNLCMHSLSSGGVTSHSEPGWPAPCHALAMQQGHATRGLLLLLSVWYAKHKALE